MPRGSGTGVAMRKIVEVSNLWGGKVWERFPGRCCPGDHGRRGSTGREQNPTAETLAFLPYGAQASSALCRRPVESNPIPRGSAPGVARVVGEKPTLLSCALKASEFLPFFCPVLSAYSCFCSLGGMS